jgi:Flp pilus assembly protein TadG
MTIVETALVLSVFLLFLFGIFEYCRFLMVLHVTNNAARDAARYATVNVNCDPSAVASTKTAILAYATQQMAGMDKNINNYAVAVYPCDQSGFAQSPPTVIPKSLTAGVAADPFNAADSNNPPWNSAVFTERIAVTIKGQYKPVLPTLLFMPAAIDVNVTAVMGSEG